MTDTTKDELVAMRDRLNALIGDDAPPPAEPPVSTPDLKQPPETFIMVDGVARPASMQPPQSDLQGAFTMGGTKAKPRIVIDMAAALPLAQDMVRAARQAVFAKNDALTMQALQNSDTKALAQAKTFGDKLRDAPSDARLTDAKTPDELLAAVDAIVGEF